jgi:hypothetical protein
MTLERVRELYDTTPFNPFTIHMADGRSIPVLSREFIMAVPTGRTVVVCQPDGKLSIIDLLLVSELELRPNGSSRPRRGRR